MAEHEAPKQIDPRGLHDYLDVMSQSIFQTGISWKVVQNKWPGTQQAFQGFDADKVAHFSDKDVDQLATDTRIIRNRRKIQAIVQNAREMVQLEEEHGGFRKYLRSHGDFEATVKDLRKRFKFLGDMGAYYFLYVVKEEVPEYGEWCASRGVEHTHS